MQDQIFGDNDLYPEKTFAQRQPFELFHNTDVDTLLGKISDKKIILAQSMMQTYKTAAQVGFMLTEMARRNMVLMVMGSEGGAIDAYKKNINNIITVLENNNDTISFFTSDQMENAIKWHNKGEPVAIIALAHHTHLQKFIDAIPEHYYDKVSIIVDEIHSKLSSTNPSQRCRQLVELIKKAKCSYLVTATMTDVIFNISDLNLDIDNDKIAYIKGPAGGWAGWPYYMSINALQPAVGSTDTSLYKNQYTKDTLFGCDIHNNTHGIKNNIGVLNKIIIADWDPLYKKFIEEADNVKGFVFTRTSDRRNVFMNTELVNAIHLKAFDCITVTIHGSGLGNTRSGQDLIVDRDTKNQYPCIAMWRREPNSAFWNAGEVGHRGLVCRSCSPNHPPPPPPPHNP